MNSSARRFRSFLKVAQASSLHPPHPTAGWKPALLSTLCMLALTGCSLLPKPTADATRYFVLTGPTQSAQSVEASGQAERGLVLGLKRIEVVSYLNGKDMVVREAGNEITYNNFARWAEPLATSISRALADSLAQSDRVRRVYAQPFPFEVERNFDVTIRVLRCEGERKPDGGGATARFSAEVQVTEAKTGGTVVLRKLFTAPEAAWDGKDFGKLASVLSESVTALGADVVAALPAK